MSSNITPHRALVSPGQRAALKAQQPCVLWFTGLSGAGKSTLSTLVDAALYERGHHTFVLDGDNMRRRLCRDLGFSDADRTENIRRVAETARLMTEAGLIVLTAFISPFRSERALARSLFAPGHLRQRAAGTGRTTRSQGALPSGTARRNPSVYRHRLSL